VKNLGPSVAGLLPVVTKLVGPLALGALAGTFGAATLAATGLLGAVDQIYQQVTGKQGIFNLFDTQFNRELAKAINNAEGEIRKLAALFTPGNTQQDLDNITKEIKDRNQVLENERLAELRRKDFNKDLREYISSQKEEINKTFKATEEFISNVPSFRVGDFDIGAKMQKSEARSCLSSILSREKHLLLRLFRITEFKS
jgi:Skp family chaperone for outer membrane proteins